MKNSFNIYAAEAGALNLEALMKNIDLLTLFLESEFNGTRDATPAQYKARVGVYIKKIISRKTREAEETQRRLQQEADRRHALGADGRQNEDAYFAEQRELYSKIELTGSTRKRAKHKIRQKLYAKYGR